MTHKIYCPHCRTTIAVGHGIPVKRLESPLIECIGCHRTVVYPDNIEWAISPWYRKAEYLLGNNRSLLCLIPLLLFVKTRISLGVVLLIYLALLSVVMLITWATATEYKIPASLKRCEDAEYVARLINADYPVAERFISHR